ncbi:MAG TPA: hypothetical protein VD995_29920 [Azospirillum sp.]|nr:hypothetical protein [Azospirillum sp.]
MRQTLHALAVASLLITASLPALAADPAKRTNAAGMTDAEYAGFACMTGGAIAGTAAVLAGSAYIIATGGAGAAGAAGSASVLAVPLLVATIAAGCTTGQIMAPAIAVLQRKGEMVVEELEEKLDKAFDKKR